MKKKSPAIMKPIAIKKPKKPGKASKSKTVVDYMKDSPKPTPMM